MDNVVNSTVVSNFAAVRRMDVLHGVAGHLFLPIEVYDEIIAGQLSGYVFYDDIEQFIAPQNENGWLELASLTVDELQTFLSLPSRLHQGERACLAMARQRGWGFLSDDRAARRQAQSWDIRISGTLGVLVLAIEDSHITIEQGNDLLKQMIRVGRYHSPVTDLRLLVRF